MPSNHVTSWAVNLVWGACCLKCVKLFSILWCVWDCGENIADVFIVSLTFRTSGRGCCRFIWRPYNDVFEASLEDYVSLKINESDCTCSCESASSSFSLPLSLVSHILLWIAVLWSCQAKPALYYSQLLSTLPWTHICLPRSEKDLFDSLSGE